MLSNAIMQLEINRGDKNMWLSIERIEWSSSMEDSYNILFKSKDIEQVINYTDLMKENAKEKGYENRTYSTSKFEPNELKAFLNDMERNERVNKDVN